MAVFTVTSNADDGTANTLRWAIQQANATAGLDNIVFNIAGRQPATITLSAALGALPPITDSVYIDGMSQAQNPMVNMPQIEIDGSALGGVSGLVVDCGNTTIAGLAIDGFNSNGIELNNPAGSAGNLVYGCHIGCGLWGTSANSGNAGNGIFIMGSNNDIGVPGTAMMPDIFGMPLLLPGWNVIAGNTQNGVDIFGSASKNNTLSGNFIGVDATGFEARANGKDGVRIEAGASGNYVGTQVPGFGFENFISGNKRNGVALVDSPNDFVDGDCIGLGVDGKTALGNFGNGVVASGFSSNEHIDGDTISDNLLSGVQFSGPGATDSTITRSAIGTDYTGMLARGNGDDGVTLDANASNTVGGGAGQYNVISGNQGNGISITGTLDKVYGNWIGTNATGDAALPNQGNGVLIVGTNNTIGSPLFPRSNTISGNLEDGIAIYGDINYVYGNSIGTNDAGTAAIPNGYNGVWIDGNNNHIGTATPGGGNLISGNTDSGVNIDGASNEVYGNKIGTNSFGAEALGNGADGVRIVGDNNRVGTTGALVENLISGNANDGVYIEGGNNKVYGDWIGTDQIGWAAIANGKNGVEVKGDNNQIGSDLIGGGNLISGNGKNGVYLNGDTNTVAQDWIGVDSTGNADLENFQTGVEIAGSNNIIGVADKTGGNVISGNGGEGIMLDTGSANVMLNNYVGVGADGKTGVGNGLTGIGLYGGTNANDRIGDAGAWDANVISANGSYGIRVQGATGTLIKNNYIGLGADGATALGNGLSGILVEKGTTNGGGSGTVIGGKTTDEGNFICNNGTRAVGGFGVDIANNTTGVTVQNNWIGLYVDANGFVFEAPNKSGWTNNPNADNDWPDNWHD